MRRPGQAATRSADGRTRMPVLASPRGAPASDFHLPRLWIVVPSQSLARTGPKQRERRRTERLRRDLPARTSEMDSCARGQPHCSRRRGQIVGDQRGSKSVRPIGFRIGVSRHELCDRLQTEWLPAMRAKVALAGLPVANGERFAAARAGEREIGHVGCRHARRIRRVICPLTSEPWF